MTEPLLPWKEALEMAVKLGLVTDECAARAAATVTDPTQVDPERLAASAGLPPLAMQSLLRLAGLVPRPPATPTLKLPPRRDGDSAIAEAIDLDLDASADAETTLMPHPVRLTLETTGASPQRWPFTGLCVIRIGRSPRADVRLDDTHASGLHAWIEMTSLGCWIHDGDGQKPSQNRTYVNGTPIEVHELKHGDEVRVGHTCLRVSMTEDGAAENGEAPPAWVPEIPGYAIQLPPLGRGSQGCVYLAKDLKRQDRLVAIKTVRLPHTFSDDPCDPKAQGFLREITNAAAFRHPHVVEVYASGMAGRTLWMAMEHLAGGDLGAYHRQVGPLPCKEACRFVLQALDAMAAAHERGYVHRDLKPENLLLTVAHPAGDVKVADLGLGKSYQFAGMSGFTATGTGAGTPAYMAPEQLTDYKYACPPADVFALGAVLFRLLTGRGVYGSVGTTAEQIAMIPDAVIPPVASLRSDIPFKVAAVIDRALQRETSRRYEHAGQMRDALLDALG